MQSGAFEIKTSARVVINWSVNYFPVCKQHEEENLEQIHGCVLVMMRDQAGGMFPYWCRQEISFYQNNY